MGDQYAFYHILGFQNGKSTIGIYL